MAGHSTRAAIGFTILLFLLPLSAAQAPAQNDAGSGGDAPDTWDAAMPVAPGTHVGFLDDVNGDRADWYSIHVPQGMALEWRVGLSNDAYVYIYDANGNRLYGYNFWVWFGYGYSQTYTFLPPTSTIHIGILEDWGDVNYDLALSVIDLPALSVDAIVLEPQGLEVDGVGSLGMTVTQIAHVTVTNSGNATATGTLDLLVHHQGGSRDRHADSERITLAAGETRTYELTWSAVGEVGDVEVEAVVDADQLEADLSDNRASARAHVLVRNAGFSVDAFNNGVVAGGVAGAWTYFGHGGTGACAMVAQAIVGSRCVGT